MFSFKKLFAVCLAITVFNASALAQSNLISQQSSVVATSIKNEAQNCANGASGTIGSSIGTAMQIHTEMASATPNVETLFDVANDCFSGVSNIFDLSFAIPSLSSILNAAKDAVMQYAQKKVCSAVSQVSGMVTSPLNQAMTNVNSYGELGDLNGLSNGLLKTGMTQLNPNLGSQYTGAQGNNYTVGVNPFNNQQTEFGNSNNNSNASNTINNCSSQINSVNTQIFSAQQEVVTLHTQYDNAQSAANSCHATQFGNCYSVDQAVISLQNQLNNKQASLTTLKNSLSSISANCYNATATQNTVQPMNMNKTTAPAQSTNESESSWFEGITNMFN